MTVHMWMSEDNLRRWFLNSILFETSLLSATVFLRLAGSRGSLVCTHHPSPEDTRIGAHHRA